MPESGHTRSSPASVIVLGVDTPIGLAVLRDVARHGYGTIGIGGDARSIGAASRHCHRFAVREREETALIAQLIRLARDGGARFLLAISEPDLLMINRHREELETVLAPLVPDGDKLAMVIDKARCVVQAEAAGLRVPATFQPQSLAHAREHADGFAFPVVLKWSDPNAVGGALAAAGLDLHKTEFACDADELLRRLAPYEAIHSFPLVQEYCPGHGIGQMFLAVDGDILLEFQHERIHEWPPEGGVSTLCRSVPLERFAETRRRSKDLLAALGWTGVAMVEYRHDRASGTDYFMEVNGRFWGSLPLAIAAGVPFAAGLVAACGEGREVPAARHPYRELSGCYFIPETKRLLRVLFGRSKIQDPFFEADRLETLISYPFNILNPSTRFFIFSLDDPGPFFRDLGNVLGKAFRLSAR